MQAFETSTADFVRIFGLNWSNKSVMYKILTF